MATTLRIKMEFPAKADKAVAKLLRAAAKSFPGAKIEESAEAPPNSYSLTVHAYPDNPKEG